MLKKEKNISLSGESRIEDKVVARFNASIAPGEGASNVSTYIVDQDLYEKNRRDVRNDINEFRQFVFDEEDKLFETDVEG
ncbi:hypothetical protein [Ligilactobacillus agilis]|uniref:hypothetical protein n=1 Tax=Ligilactobacillus agilis TaxID=1601 RepID=UPI00242BDFE6|nr:hypothetical protein [Ligilactobacillus agilis]